MSDGGRCTSDLRGAARAAREAQRQAARRHRQGDRRAGRRRRPDAVGPRRGRSRAARRRAGARQDAARAHARAAASISSFSRIQFTPDLMPSDVMGTNVLVIDAAQRRRGMFALHKGPIFGQVVLADEINRATPKTQSALLEAMARARGAPSPGTRHALEEPFFVLATENPIEMEGTYPLPEAQLDRFLLKVVVPSPTEDEMTRDPRRARRAAIAAAPPRVLDARRACSRCARSAATSPSPSRCCATRRASCGRAIRRRPSAPEIGEARAPLRRGRARRAVARARRQGRGAARRARARRRSRTCSAWPSPCCATGSSAPSRARPTASRPTRWSTRCSRPCRRGPSAVEQAIAR